MAHVLVGLITLRQIERRQRERRKSRREQYSTKNGHFYRNRKAHLP
jgi:hypothetical protein